MDGDAVRKGRGTVINMIEVAVVWNDPGLFEGMWAYAAREPGLEVREASTAALLRRDEPRPDVVLVEVARGEGTDPVADVRALCRADHRVLALSRNTDPGLSASLLGTGACLLLGRKQTIRAIVAAIRASGRTGSNGLASSNGHTRATGRADRHSAAGPPRLSRRRRSGLLSPSSQLTLDAPAQPGDAL